jgi:hypothetical protein
MSTTALDVGFVARAAGGRDAVRTITGRRPPPRRLTERSLCTPAQQVVTFGHAGAGQWLPQAALHLAAG